MKSAISEIPPSIYARGLVTEVIRELAHPWKPKRIPRGHGKLKCSGMSMCFVTPIVIRAWPAESRGFVQWHFACGDFALMAGIVGSSVADEMIERAWEQFVAEIDT